MPLTHIDPVAALIAIDLQKGVVALPVQPHSAAGVIANTARLAAAFRTKNFPVVFVNVEARAPGRTDSAVTFNPPPDWADLVAELGREPGDYTVTKHQVGAFYGTALERILRRAGVTQTFFTGIATTMGVEASARNAHDRGYNVVLVEDAMSDTSAENHRHAFAATFPRIGEITTTAAVLAVL